MDFLNVLTSKKQGRIYFDLPLLQLEQQAGK